MTRIRNILFLIFIGMIIFPINTVAHLASGRFGDFYAGSFHLLTAIEHLIPMIALGLLAGQQGTKISRLMVFLIPVTLIIGTLVGIYTSGLTFSIYINSFSFLLIGGLVALNKKLSPNLILLIILILGITHGYSNGTAFEPTLSVFNYVIGVATTGLIIVTIFAGIALSVKKDWQKIAVRVAGSWIAAIGLITLPMILK